MLAKIISCTTTGDIHTIFIIIITIIVVIIISIIIIIVIIRLVAPNFSSFLRQKCS